MSQPSNNPGRYRVVYSEHVRQELRNLLTRAAQRGLGQQFLEAVRQVDIRLRVYPQFGEPLRDLQTAGETVWIGTIPPLVVQYIVDEEKRLVFVVVPLDPLPNSGV